MCCDFFVQPTQMTRSERVKEHSFVCMLSPLINQQKATSLRLLHFSMPIIYQAGELSENSLISESFVLTSEKNRQVFLLNAYAFRFIFFIF
jgi:hypothetical protein